MAGGSRAAILPGQPTARCWQPGWRQGILLLRGPRILFPAGRAAARLQLPASLAPPPSSPSQTPRAASLKHEALPKKKPVLQQNFLRVCFEPAVRYAAEIDPRISRISPHELVGFTLAAGQSLHCWAALFPRGAVNLLFFPGGDVVSWECPQNTWWVSSSPVSAIFNKPGRWPLPALTPLLLLSIWADDPDIALLPAISPCC